MISKSRGIWIALSIAAGAACSSGGGNDNAAGASGSGAQGGSAGASGSGGTAGSSSDGGPGGQGGSAGTGGSAGSAGAAGSGGSEPLPTDVKDSAACKSWCAALDAACGQPKCVPEEDCKIPAGQCAASTEAYLACQAQTGSFSCGGDGHTIVHSCKKDASSCPPGSIVGASCEGHCGGEAPAGCYCDPTCKQYNDCCADFDQKCGSGGTGGSGGSGGSSGAPKTCAEANNGKGCCGWGATPYDQIAYKCSGGGVVAEQCGILGCVVDANGYAACGTGTEYPSLPNCFSN